MDTHTQTHRGVRAEATIQGKQEQLGPESCMGKGDGVILGAMGATLEVREWEEVLHKVRHGTYTTEEHSNRHEGHKTHNGQVTDHTAWTKCDMTTCCRVGPIQSLLQQSRGKKARTLPTQPTLSSTQLDFPLQQGFCHNCSQLQPHGASVPHTKISLCLELLLAAMGHA